MAARQWQDELSSLFNVAGFFSLCFCPGGMRSSMTMIRCETETPTVAYLAKLTAEKLVIHSQNADNDFQFVNMRETDIEDEIKCENRRFTNFEIKE